MATLQAAESTTSASLPAPTSVAATGVRRAVLEDLALKTIYIEGEINVRALADRMGVEFAIADEIFQRLRKRKLCDVTGLDGFVHRVTPNENGSSAAQELLGKSEYAGYAPVSLAEYISRVRAQTVRRTDVHEGDVDRALTDLVLGDVVRKQIGVAILSGTSIVLYGPSGTGKTAIAERIPDVYQGGVWVPYAVELDGQIIVVFDPTVHRRIEQTMPPGADRRWVLCHRPRVTVGGELTIEMLDLQIDPVSGVYVAPLQMKANNGVLIVDDFGRQRVPPEALLNRWIVPLDRKIDFFTMRGGRKFEMPFDSLIVFSTNLDAKSVFALHSGSAALNDDAFLRRIPNKIRVDYVARDEFLQIFRGVCTQFDVGYDEALAVRLMDHLESVLHEPFRPCYPRDLVQQVCWEARFDQRPPALDWLALMRACHTYFITPT